jgi:diguanylate cyclase (GGDEF)-like protein
MFHPSTNLRQIIVAAADPEIDLRKLGRMVDEEAGLPERLVRYVNGFYTRLGGQLTTATRALAVVGPRVVVETATHHALVTAVTHAGIPPKLFSVIWSDSVRRAVGCRLLAEAHRADLSADSAYTLGLMLEFGTAILLCREPSLQLRWARDVRRLAGQERLEAETRLFGMDRAEAFHSIASDWGLPEELVLYTTEYMRTEREGVTRSNEVWFDLATWANALGEALASPTSGKDLRYWATGASKAFSLKDASANEVVTQTLKRTPSSAAASGVNVSKQPPVQDLRNRNSTGGIAEQDTHELVEWIEIIEEQHQLSSGRVEELQTTIRQQGARDVVTGLMTVQALLVQLEVDVQSARHRDQSLAIILMDIDGFTELNRHYGYNVGDMVLRKAGQTLKKVLRGMEAVARVGADSFALMYTGDARAAKVVGERARAAIEAMRVDVGNNRIQVTGTVAGYNLSDMPATADAQQFLSAAQQVLNTRHSLPDNRTIWPDHEVTTVPPVVRRLGPTR